jgi:hypothetical protein
MMIRLDPGFVSGPRSCIPNAKIVGNIIDIKKAIPIIAYNVIMPDPKMVTRLRRIQNKEYMVNSLGGGTNFIKNVPTNLPTIKARPAALE